MKYDEEDIKELLIEYGVSDEELKNYMNDLKRISKIHIEKCYYVLRSGNGVYVGCGIRNDRFYLDSEIDCDEFSNELHYRISKSSTIKLLSIMTMKELVKYLKPWPSERLEKLLEENNIKYQK